MKRLTFSAVVATALALGAYTLAGAQGPGRPGGGQRPGGGPGAMMMMLRGLDLSEAQRAQIRAFAEAQRASGSTVGAERQLHRQLQAELFAEAPDSQKIGELQQQLAQAHTERVAQQITLAQQVAQVLTPEQRHTLRERLANAPQRRGPGR